MSAQPVEPGPVETAGDATEMAAWRRRVEQRVAGRDLSGVVVPQGETPEDVAERQRAQALGRARYWRESAGEYADATFAGFRPQQDRCARTGKSPAVTDWLDSDSRNLVLTGPSRRGKTYAAYAIGNAALLRGVWVVGYRMARLNADLRSDSKRERAQEIVDRVPLLVLDDLGSEHTTDWTAERLQDVLDERLSHADRRTIVTTNLAWRRREDSDADGMVERYGDRIARRLVENARVVTIDGEPLAGPDPW